jgi:hypothetical protein
VVAAGGPAVTVTYVNELSDTNLAGQITNGANLAGYMSWGCHSLLGPYYATNGVDIWSGNSDWWIIDTIESFNGQQYYGASVQGCLLYWFSTGAFGGTNYSHTPVGAVSHVDEPSASGANSYWGYFGLWQAGRNFAQCAWISMPPASSFEYHVNTIQVTGDPFIKR